MLNSEQKKKISAYLLTNRCNPSLKGFDILVDLISLSVEEPDLNKSQLFSRYVSEHEGISENAAYRAVKYLLDGSLCSEKRVYAMIKTVSLQMRAML